MQSKQANNYAKWQDQSSFSAKNVSSPSLSFSMKDENVPRTFKFLIEIYRATWVVDFGNSIRSFFRPRIEFHSLHFTLKMSKYNFYLDNRMKRKNREFWVTWYENYIRLSFGPRVKLLNLKSDLAKLSFFEKLSQVPKNILCRSIRATTSLNYLWDSRFKIRCLK